MSQAFPIIAGYTIRNKIGDGGFSKVYRAVNYTANSVAACKIVPITEKTWDATRKKELYKEIKVHSQLKHEHILDFLASETYEDDQTTAAKGIVPAVYMLLELAAGGDLFDKIVPDIGVTEKVAHLYFTQLIAGLTYVHSKGVCHRDMKPENVMLNINGLLKICDFGLCAVYKHKGMERLLTERCGSLPYVAPELNGSQPYQAEPVDIWGCGVILFCLLVGNTPWDEPTDASPEYVEFINGTIFQSSPWNRISAPALVDFLLRLLTANPSKRITLAEIPNDPWFAQNNTLLRADEVVWANALSNPLQESGYLDVVNPPPSSRPEESDDMDVDNDNRMLTNTNISQFTQSLMLFSQTQGGTRYTPELTRFYTRDGCDPETFINTAVPVFQQQFSFKCRSPDVTLYDSGDKAGQIRRISMKIAGEDARKMPLRGYVDVEPYNGGSFVVMRREAGDPLAWKRLWRSLGSSGPISPNVLRKTD
ncbi:Chk1 protein kinase [Tulasnella sp. 403]|nr:Chk1 protein kinase [Tulasnella sp. 403]